MVENTDFTAPPDPMILFREWLALAEQHEPNDANAMALATVGAGGMPSARMVLLKDFNADGFVFFTNRESRKGEQLRSQSKAALCLHWKSLRRQVRIEGPVTKVSDAESDAYHATRPRGSQIGAWASQQSRPLADRKTLEDAVAKFEKHYEGKPVPRPPHWGGYRVAPLYIEFWQDRLYRLHDRVIYQRDTPQAAWQVERFYP